MDMVSVSQDKPLKKTRIKIPDRQEIMWQNCKEQKGVDLVQNSERERERPHWEKTNM